MKFWDNEKVRWVTHEELAAALRPLLAQSAPADVHAVPHPDWRSPTHLVALAEADTGPCPTWAATLTPRPAAEPTEAEQVRYWKDAAAAARREALFSARDDVAAIDAAKQLAELQLDNARQEIAALRQRLAAADAQSGRLMADLASVTDERDWFCVELSQANASARKKANAECDRLRGYNATLADAIASLTAERDAWADKWAAIPWAALAVQLAPHSSTWSDSIAMQWYRANRPGEVSD